MVMVSCSVAMICLRANDFSAVQAVGYETISFLGDGSESFTRGPWWTSFFRQPAPFCDPHQILEGDAFRTDGAIFDYKVDAIGAYDPLNGVHAGFSVTNNALAYSADPLAAACEENLRTMFPRVLALRADGLQKTVTAAVSLYVFSKSKNIVIE